MINIEELEKQNNELINTLLKEKKFTTHNLFLNLEDAKQSIAIEFSENYFDGDFDFHWLGEVLMIGDYYIDLKDIQFALCGETSEETLFKYLGKLRHYDLEDFILGKKGRQKKNKKELKELEKRVKESFNQLQECIDSDKQNKEYNNNKF